MIAIRQSVGAYLFWVALLWIGSFAEQNSVCAEQPLQGFLIRLDPGDRLTVKRVDPRHVDLGKGARGLIVWTEGHGERWGFISESWEMPSPSLGNTLDASR